MKRVEPIAAFTVVCHIAVSRFAVVSGCLLFFCKCVLSSFTPLAFTKELGILSCMILVFCSTSSPFGLHYASLHRCPAHPCTMLILHTKQLGWLSHHFPKRFQVFFGSFGTTLSFPCCSSNARSPSKHIQTISML